MALSEETRAIVRSFCNYIEDTVGHDPRYGAVSKVANAGGSVCALRLQNSETDCFEIAILPDQKSLRVAFVTTDPDRCGEIEEAGKEAGETVDDMIRLGMAEMGITRVQANVAPYPGADNEHGFATAIHLEDLEDLDQPAVRDTALGMLEAYMIALGGMLDADLEYEEFDDEV